MSIFNVISLPGMTPGESGKLAALKRQIHDCVSALHTGQDETFNREYHEAHDHYFTLLNAQAENGGNP